MVKIGITLLTVLIAFQSYGQEKKWTLQECIDYGVAQSLTMERQLLNNKIDNAYLRDARLDLLPNISGSSSLEYSFGRSIGADNTYVDSRILANNYRVGANLNLFSGFTAINTLRYRKVSKLRGLQDSEKTANDIAVNIMQAFYDLAYAEGLIEISQEQLENARLQLKRMERQHELGIKPKSDLFDIQAQLAESEYNLIANQNKKATALVTLKQAMNYNPDEKLDIEVSSLSSNIPETHDLSIAEIYGKAKEDLPEVSAAEYAFRATELVHHQRSVVPQFRSFRYIEHLLLRFSGKFLPFSNKKQSGKKFRIQRKYSHIRGTFPAFYGIPQQIPDAGCRIRLSRNITICI